MFGYDEVLDDVRFAFTDRFGGTSQAPYGELNLGSAVGDDAEAVTANFRLIAAEFGVRPEGVVRVSQVHGRDVSVVRPDDELPMQPMPKADGVVTTRDDVVLCVRAADCLPVLLAGDGVIGAAHSGRKGMYVGVVPATVEAMRELGATRITAVLGPYACGNCYEVPAEMRNEVAERVPASYAETSWVRRPSTWRPGSAHNWTSWASRWSTRRRARSSRRPCTRTGGKAPSVAGWPAWSSWAR